MEIILKEDVVNLGYKNDIVTVKSGYGRNYLIPTGKAVIASPSAKKMLAEELKQRAHKLEKIKKDAEAMAEQLKDVTLTIATKVSATGTIFGSVSNIQIAEELEKLGHKVDRKIIVVKDAVKEVGGQMFICADHGNCEQLIDYETGEPYTAHTTNPVPFILVNYDPAYTLREGGCLADIAPTLIEMMGMEQPKEMTGKSLIVK